MYYLGDRKSSSPQKYLVLCNKYATAGLQLIIPHDINGGLKNASTLFFSSLVCHYSSSAILLEKLAHKCVMQDQRDK